MKATVKWQNGLNFVGANETGRELCLSGSGDDLSPMETVLQSVGACSSIDVVMILQKSRVEVTHCECQLEAIRAETDPKVFTQIHAHFIVAGNELTEKQVRRACELSLEKYCSVALMLSGNVKISHSFELTNI